MKGLNFQMQRILERLMLSFPSKNNNRHILRGYESQVNGDGNVYPILHTNILKGKQLLMYFQYSSYEFPAIYK